MLNEQTRERIESIIRSDRVVLFMKGTREAPQCGFSAAVVEVLDEVVPEYTTVNVLTDQTIREGIKEYSNWPTIPQLYVEGEFIGGCDIVRDLYASGELFEKLGVKPPERKVPTIHITEAARKALMPHLERAEGMYLHLSIDRGFETSLGFAPRRPGDLEVDAGGITLVMDPGTARRADGLIIDHEQTATGSGFRINNPNDLRNRTS